MPLSSSVFCRGSDLMFLPNEGILRMKLKPRMYMRGLCITLLALLGSVFRSPALAAIDAQRIQRAAHDVIADARQVANASAAHQHDRVFLKIVLFAGNIGRDFLAIAQPHPRN